MGDAMTTLREAAQQALEALGSTLSAVDGYYYDAVVPPAEQALEALRAALAEPQGEPVAWRDLYYRAINEANGLTNYVEDRPELRRAERNLSAIEEKARALSAAPPQRQPLTDAETERLYRNIKPSQQQDARSLAAFKRLMRVFESAYGIGEKP